MRSGNATGWMRWGWAAALAMALAGCGGSAINPQYRPQDGNAVQSPYDVASAGDEVFTRQSDTFPLATVSLPANPSQPAKVETVLDVLKPATPATGPAIHPAPTPEPLPTQIIGGESTTMPDASPALPTGATPQIALPAKVVGQDKQVGDVTASTDASGNLDLFVTSPTGVGTVTLEKTGDTWPAHVNVHLSYSKDRPLAAIAGASASELLPSGQALPLKTTSSAEGVTVSVPGFTRSPRIQIQWIDKYR